MINMCRSMIRIKWNCQEYRQIFQFKQTKKLISFRLISEILSKLCEVCLFSLCRNRCFYESLETNNCKCQAVHALGMPTVIYNMEREYPAANARNRRVVLQLQGNPCVPLPSRLNQLNIETPPMTSHQYVHHWPLLPR